MSGLSSLPRALRRMSLYGWVFGLLSLFLVGVCVASAGVALDVARTHYLGGVAGTLVVDDCEWSEGSTGGWQCTGEFVSDDGRLRLPEVGLRPHQHEWPPEPVGARVSGPTATVAWVPAGGEWIRIAALGVFAYLAFWTGRQAIRSALAEQEQRLQVARHGRPPAPRQAAPRQAAPRAPDRDAEDREPVPRRVPRLLLPLAAYLALLVATGWVIWSTVQWNQEQDARLSAHATGEVVATQLGSDDRIEVDWTDHLGRGWLTRFTPGAADAYAVGDPLELRYDPDWRVDPVPVDADRFDLPVRDRNAWTGILLAPGLLLGWAWTWRLGRWASGALRRARPVRVEVLVSQLAWAGQPVPVVAGGGTHLTTATEEPIAYWLRLQEDSGRTWYQRAMWHHRLADFAAAGRGPEAQARPCPGLRRMLLVDIPGVGRLWPASTARRRPPRNYLLVGFDPRRVGETHRDGWVAKGLGIGALVAFGVVLWALSGPAAAAYGPLLLISYWCWAGATPWHGLYLRRTVRGRGRRAVVSDSP